MFKVQYGSVPSISVAVLGLACTSNESGLSCQLDCVFYGYKKFLPPYISTLEISTPDFSSFGFSSPDFFSNLDFSTIDFSKIWTEKSRIEKFMDEKSGAQSWVGNVL